MANVDIGGAFIALFIVTYCGVAIFAPDVIHEFQTKLWGGRLPYSVRTVRVGGILFLLCAAVIYVLEQTGYIP